MNKMHQPLYYKNTKSLVYNLFWECKDGWMEKIISISIDTPSALIKTQIHFS